VAFDVDGRVSETPWPSEEIPGEHLLYCRVHANWRTPAGTIPPAAFVGKRNANGMFEQSADWCRYSTPQDTRDRAREPLRNGVYKVTVADLRAIPGELVVHSPIQTKPGLPDNRAHTDVLGSDHEDPEIKRQFSRIYKEGIPVP
jgi:hypothetical protein